MKKVFCKDCKFADGIVCNSNTSIEIVCVCPSNIKKKLVRLNWYEQIFEIKYKQKPKEINKNNDCENYEEVKDGK